MRLKQDTKQKIVNYAKKYFGDDIKLYLFGSRVYDNKKGGDIDLFLETEQNIDISLKVSFLKNIYKNVTQRKVDLLIKSPLNQNRPIFETAKNEGILLC